MSSDWIEDAMSMSLLHTATESVVKQSDLLFCNIYRSTDQRNNIPKHNLSNNIIPKDQIYLNSKDKN